ncbi:MAG: sensor protein CutS [Acidimicrobiales bacterium]|nr:MAG: sensor protein CutS [Acidimicrobiales bacterium]
MNRSGVGLADRMPDRFGSLRTRLALLYSIVLFVLAAVMVGAIYLGLSRALSDEPMSRLARFEQLATDAAQASEVESASLVPDERTPRPWLVIFEEEVNRRALERLRAYSFTALAGLFLGSLLVGWYVAGLVLRPIGRISAVAREITATDLSRRIDLGGPSDELRDLADTFDEMLGRLDESFEGQRRFVAEASHELRNPLAVLRTNLDVVMADPEAGPEDFRAAGVVALRAAERMSVLVDDLLLYAHHERPDAAREPLDLAVVVAETVEDFGAAAGRSGVGLELVQRTGLAVLADAAAVRRAVANLLSNAIRVSDHGGSIQVSTGGDDDLVWVSVVDDGPGITAEHLDHVFQRFWRGDRSSTREVGRSGLGLAIVRQIAEGHGGRATVRSTPGEGATFTVWLPRYVNRVVARRERT